MKLWTITTTHNKQVSRQTSVLIQSIVASYNQNELIDGMLDSELNLCLRGKLKENGTQPTIEETQHKEMRLKSSP